MRRFRSQCHQHLGCRNKRFRRNRRNLQRIHRASLVRYIWLLSKALDEMGGGEQRGTMAQSTSAEQLFQAHLDWAVNIARNIAPVRSLTR
jgi:hypothetical protein